MCPLTLIDTGSIKVEFKDIAFSQEIHRLLENDDHAGAALHFRQTAPNKPHLWNEFNGDGLIGCAPRYHLTLAQAERLNNLSNCAFIDGFISLIKDFGIANVFEQLAQDKLITDDQKQTVLVNLLLHPDGFFKPEELNEAIDEFFSAWRDKLLKAVLAEFLVKRNAILKDLVRDAKDNDKVTKANALTAVGASFSSTDSKDCKSAKNVASKVDVTSILNALKAAKTTPKVMQSKWLTFLSKDATTELLNRFEYAFLRLGHIMPVAVTEKTQLLSPFKSYDSL